MVLQKKHQDQIRFLLQFFPRGEKKCQDDGGGKFKQIQIEFASLSLSFCFVCLTIIVSLKKGQKVQGSLDNIFSPRRNFFLYMLNFVHKSSVDKNFLHDRVVLKVYT